MALKNEILQYALETYGTEPEYPFAPDDGTTAVLRQAVNRKWYAIIMQVSGRRLGLACEGNVTVMNVKCDPLLIGSLLLGEGFLPAYHMNKKHWVTILLDGTVPMSDLCGLLDMSFDLTKPKVKQRKNSR